MELTRYRWTSGAVDVPFLMGAVGATALSGPALLGLLQMLGRKESAARNLLIRMKAIGTLDVQTKGRVNVYRMASASVGRYQEVEGTAGENPWAGYFHSLVYSVPETQRVLRDRILHVAQNAGYGLLRPGVMIAASDRWGRLRLDEDMARDEAWMMRTTLTPNSLSDARKMANIAWDLKALAGSYRVALKACSDVPATIEPDAAALVAWQQLYSTFLEPQLKDPHLPDVLLPKVWPVTEFLEVQKNVNARIGGAIQPFLRQHTDKLDPGGVNEYYRSPWSL